MNVSFEIGEMINGFKVVGSNSREKYVVENENIRITFRTDSFEGRNYSKIISCYDKRTNRTYYSPRFLVKRVPLVQGFSNQLYMKYKEKNEVTV